MGFEDKFLAGLDRRRERREELSPTMTRAYERARKQVLENPDYSIQESAFADIYGAERVEADMEVVKRLERRFTDGQTTESMNAKKIAETFEAIILMQSELSEWFGNATTLKTAKYDDYKNKVDMLAEWYTPEDGTRLLALAVDVTYGIQAVQKKFEDIKAEIDSGRLGSVRYFKDSRDNFMGTRNNVPRTVIGVSQSVVEQLASLWLEGEKRQLGQHPVQRVLVDQMNTQLLLMRDYAHRTNQGLVANAYDEALSAVRPVHSSKLDIRTQSLDADPVAKEIARKTQEVFRTR